MSLKPLTSADLRTRAEAKGGALPALMVAAERAVQTILSGDHKQRKPGPGERFWQYREYNTADRPQDIDWRQSAKGDTVFVREKEKQNAQNIILWCAHDAGMDYQSDDAPLSKNDTAKIFALALGLLLTRGHETISLAGGSFKPGRTEKTLQLFAEELCAGHTEEFEMLAHMPLPKNASFILIGDFLNDIAETEQTIKTLSMRAQGGLMLQVLDPAEIDLPFSGRTIFQHPISGEKERIDHIESIRAQYASRIRAHQEALTDLAGRHGWNFAWHRTDHDIADTLFDLWMMVSRAANGGHRI